MQVELKIKETLRESTSVEKKVKELCEFMNWNRIKLTKAILKYGTSTNKQCSAVINEFWGNNHS